MFLLDRFHVLIGGTASCSYWRAGFLFLLEIRFLVLIDGPASCSYWRGVFLFLLEGRFLVLIGGSVSCSYCVLLVFLSRGKVS